MPVDYSRTWSCCYIAAAVQAIAVNLAPLFFAMFSAQFAISFEKIGRLVLISFLAQLITDLIAVFFVDRFGYRTCLVTAHGAVALGLIAFGILPSVLEHAYVSMTVSAVIYSVGAGMLEVLISPLTQALPGTNKSASMSMVHSFYSWGQVAVILLTTVAVTVCGDKYWWVMFIVWALLPLYNLVCGLRAPLPPVIPREERASSVQLFKTPLFWLMMLLMMCGGAAEQVIYR